MAELSAGYVWLVLAGLLCAPFFLAASSDAKRRLGIWLIAKADAADKAQSHFAARRAELQAALGVRK